MDLCGGGVIGGKCRQKLPDPRARPGGGLLALGRCISGDRGVQPHHQQEKGRVLEDGARPHQFIYIILASLRVA